MRTIYKYVLPLDDGMSIRMPRGAEPLTVAEQNGKLCVWALVDSEAEEVAHRFELVGTGHTADDLKRSEYLGSVHNARGLGLVFHVFDCGEREPWED